MQWRHLANKIHFKLRTRGKSLRKHSYLKASLLSSKRETLAKHAKWVLQTKVSKGRYFFKCCFLLYSILWRCADAYFFALGKYHIRAILVGINWRFLFSLYSFLFAIVPKLKAKEDLLREILWFSMSLNLLQPSNVLRCSSYGVRTRRSYAIMHKLPLLCLWLARVSMLSFVVILQS